MSALTCWELIDFLSDYLDGELPVESRLIFDGHLSVCLNCRNYLDNFRATLNAARVACQQEPAQWPLVPEELVQAILLSRTTVQGE